MNDYKVKVKGKRYIYKTNIKLTRKGEGAIESGDKPSIELSTPAEFGGKKGTWTPEDLLVASVNACLMTTFSYYAGKRGLKFVSYESSAEGIIELVEMRYLFSKITIKPKITVEFKGDIRVAENLLKISKESCFVSNSVKAKVTLEPKVESIS
jgi:organic hydroperoxide reductase OsmC/OhrA